MDIQKNIITINEFNGKFRIWENIEGPANLFPAETVLRVVK